MIYQTFMPNGDIDTDKYKYIKIPNGYNKIDIFILSAILTFSIIKFLQAYLI